VNSTLQKSKTFSCLHRYTKRPICSNPCDGFDDLCEDYEDEKCREVSFKLIMALVGFSIISLTLLIKQTQKCIGHWSLSDRNAEGGNNDTGFIRDISRKVSYEKYRDLRQEEAFGSSLANLLVHFKSTSNISAAYEVSSHYYKMEKQYNGQNSEITDMVCFYLLGTDATTMQMYDCVEMSIGFKIESYVIGHVPKHLLTLFGSNVICYMLSALMYCKKVLLHYADLTKDFFLVWQIWIMIFGSNSFALLRNDHDFPTVVFWVTLSAIASSELSNMLTLLYCDTFPKWSRAQTCISCLFVPLMPAFVFYKELELDLKMTKIHNLLKKNEGNGSSTSQTHADLLDNRNNLHAFKVLRAQFKCNENVVEHFFQLIVLIMIIVLSKFDTIKVTSLDKIVLNDNETFLIWSTLISCFSLLSGQLSYISANKRGFLPLTGKLILALYFSICLSVRVLAIILFYTPILGLFGTNRHGKFGYMRDIYSEAIIYDVIENDQPVTLTEAWNNFTLNGSDFNPMPKYSSLFPPVLLLIHWCVSFILLSCILKGKTWTKGKQMLQSLYTILYPPVVVDWETIYRLNNGKLSIKTCWKKSKRFMIVQIAINFMQHILLCVPLMLLKVAIDKRNEDLAAGGFYPLKDELYSSQNVNDLLIAGLSVSVISPLVQWSLIYIYFKVGHPWSRILNRN
jgi:hypothetical protein